MQERLEELLLMAIKKNVSDIHITNTNGTMKIEFRVNNDLVEVKSIEKDRKLLKYLQYLSNIDMGNLLNPTSGRFDLFINNQHKSFRFSIMYSKNIINGVLRILNYDLKLNIDTLSTDEKQNNYFKSINDMNNGLILVTGPTSSGKTTTLYTILNGLKNKKIYTLEDPIEVVSDNYLQLQVNEKTMDYDAGIKQLLRHDPDVIMIGEIRDAITASMAIRASLTGHLVLSSIHSSNPTNCIKRLNDLNIDDTLLESSLKGIINQRLFKYKYKEGRCAIYEIFDESDIQYYIKFKKCKNSYKKLEHYIEKANKKKIIDFK